LTAVQVLDRLKQNGHQILSYEGYTGGLVAPVSDSNPWHYKFSWNPRNVVLAGQGGPAQFLKLNQNSQLNYPDIFREVIKVGLEDFPDLVGYFNRNSLPYADLYGIPSAHSVIRGTLRHRHFCIAWYPVAYWGLNSPRALEPESIVNLPSSDTLFHRLSYELSYTEAECRVVQELWDYLGIWELIESLRYQYTNGVVGLNSNVNSETSSPAEWLESRMTQRMSLSPTDRDMVLMTHLIRTTNPDGQAEIHRCTLYLEGEGGDKSAMAKTVGLPLAMAVELYLQGKIQDTGLKRPLSSQWYSSILPALENQGIRMRHIVTKV
jgi:hypothetical protein